MKDERKTKEQLINELAELRQRIAELEALETERRRAEEALRESEERHRTLIEQSLQGLAVVQDFCIVFANTAFAEISGYAVEELLSLSPEEVGAMIHPEDQALVWGRFRDRLAGKPVPPRYEYRGIRKDGTVRWLEMFASRIEYRGKPAIQGVIVDSTQRKRADEALRISENRLAMAVEASGAGVYDHAVPIEQGCYHSERWAEILGYKREELPQPEMFMQWLTSQIHPDDLPRLEKAYSDFIQNPESKYDVEIRMKHKSGNWIYVHGLSSAVVRDENGHAKHIVGVMLDITARKRAEERLQESEERFRNIFEFAPIGVGIVNAEGKPLRANRAFQEIFGSTEDELRSMVFHDYTHPDDVEDSLRLFRALLEGESDYLRTEKRYYAKDGHLIWGQVAASTVRDANGEFQYLIAMVEDVTERKRAEELLQTLNEAALAMQRALTHQEMFTAVAEGFKKLGLSCIVFPTDESQSRLFTKYMSYESRALKAAEKLVGIQHEDFSFPIETVDVFREVVWEGKTVFVENAEDAMRQLLPEPVKRFAGQIVKMLKVLKAINAPLIVEDQIVGVLSVQSNDLTEEDIPAITAFAHQMVAAWRRARYRVSRSRGSSPNRGQRSLRRSRSRFCKAWLRGQ